MSWSEFDTKMACIAGAASAGLVGLLLLGGCTPAGVAGATGIGAALGVGASSVATAANVLNTAYQDGQLFCAAEGSVVAVVDATTGKAYVVTNKSAATVAAVCKLIAPGGIPVVPPSQPSQTPAVAIIPHTV